MIHPDHQISSHNERNAHLSPIGASRSGLAIELFEWDGPDRVVWLSFMVGFEAAIGHLAHCDEVGIVMQPAIPRDADLSDGLPSAVVDQDKATLDCHEQ